RLPHRARALEILRRPDMVGAAASVVPKPATGEGPSPNLANNQLAGGDGTALDVPMMGRIAAGTPIEAIRQPDNFVQVPEALIGAKAEDIYALEVAGDSMVEAGIMDGDTVLIERCDQASNGVIVVALVDGEEVTLKRLRKNGNAVALEPANRDYEIQLFNADQVQVQGRLIGLMRQY
ncbi:MAG: transcriptional repressor LexA, partial [Pseudomonadota bacterium]